MYAIYMASMLYDISKTAHLTMCRQTVCGQTLSLRVYLEWGRGKGLKISLYIFTINILNDKISKIDNKRKPYLAPYLVCIMCLERYY